MTCYFKIIENYNSKTNIIRSSVSEFAEIIRRHYSDPSLSVLEVLSNTNKQHFYIDIDGVDESHSLDFVNQFIINVVVNFEAYCHKFLHIRQNIDFVNHTHISYNSGSNTHPGHSFHLIFPIAFVSDIPKRLEAFMREFVEYYKKTETNKLFVDLSKHIDLTIYNRNRLFRVIGSCAPGRTKKINGKIIRIPRNIESMHFPIKLFYDNSIGKLRSLVVDDNTIPKLETIKNYIIQNVETLTPVFCLKPLVSDELVKKYTSTKIYNYIRSESQPCIPNIIKPSFVKFSVPKLSQLHINPAIFKAINDIISQNQEKPILKAVKSLFADIDKLLVSDSFIQSLGLFSNSVIAGLTFHRMKIKELSSSNASDKQTLKLKLNHYYNIVLLLTKSRFNFEDLNSVINSVIDEFKKLENKTYKSEDVFHFILHSKYTTGYTQFIYKLFSFTSAQIKAQTLSTKINILLVMYEFSVNTFLKS